MTKKLLASSATIEGLQKLVNEYFFSSGWKIIECDDDYYGKKFLHCFNEKEYRILPSVYKVGKSKQRFIFYTLK